MIAFNDFGVFEACVKDGSGALSIKIGTHPDFLSGSGNGQPDPAPIAIGVTEGHAQIRNRCVRLKKPLYCFGKIFFPQFFIVFAAFYDYCFG
jgi:hypothetical protein